MIGIAIVLTSTLLTVVPTVIFGMIDLQFAAANEAYPTYHAMFRQVSEENMDKMHCRLSYIGTFRYDGTRAGSG